MKDIKEQILYKCIKCGSCCRAGLEISIHKEDVFKWIESDNHELLKNIQIDAKSISSEGLAGYHIEEKNALLEILNNYDKKFYEIKKQELKNFILNNHEYVGNGIIPLPIYTFIQELGRMPILLPHNFNIILEGINNKIDYIIKFNNEGTCPFLKNNTCSIHVIKPLDCKQFPYDDKGNIKNDNYFLKTCKGVKKKKF